MSKINIIDLARAYPDVNLTIRAGDLAEFGEHLITDIMRKAEMVRSTEERLLSPEQVSNMLQVSDTTIWRMEQDGRLHSVLVRGQKRYRYSEIMKIING
ncbi:MAG: helix-turn-helix domain-containing protein [Bacteroidales bacterium]|nr:helix-turn-helix domain-containing protein [Bacteroidales bacterium]